MARKKPASKRKYGKKASEKVARAMHEMKRGTLTSGRSGKKVTSRKQAIAIGLSQARRAGGKVPPPPAHATMQSKYGNEPGAWDAGFRYGKESALHETSASARDVLRQLRTSARTNFDRGQIAGYEDVWGLTRTQGTEGRPARRHAVKKSPAQLDAEIAEALSWSRGRSHATKATVDANLFAVEIDPSEFSPQRKLPEGARWREDLTTLAEGELARGRTYRRPKNARYVVIEWAGFRAAIGALLDWLEATPGVTRYAEIFE
jgi:hypothetical protein